MNIDEITLVLALLGLFVGSFAGATVWRIRAHQLREDDAEGEKLSTEDKHLLKKLKKTSVMKDRSVCLHCGHQLAWYDLIPVVSWVSSLGRCRHCHKSIGWFEPAIELGMAAFFAVSYMVWPQPFDTSLEIAQFVLWLITGTGLAILSVYDFKWFLLPNRVMFPLIGVGLVNSALVLYASQFALSAVMNIIYSCLILSGLYYLIYVASRHRWVGFGDIKLGLVLALTLVDWQLSLMALFLANAIGTLLVLPLLLSGKMKRNTRIPFGPLLISGWLIAGLFGVEIAHWYLALILGGTL